MKGRQILIEPLPGGGHAAALMVDGRIEDLLIDAADDPAPRPEAIHRAIAGRPMKGTGGAMVELGGGATGFLRSARSPAPGSRLLVQVSGHAEPGKAVPVGTRLRLKGRLALLTPGAPGRNIARSIHDPDTRAALGEIAAMAMASAPPETGVILRSAAAAAPPEAVAAEIAALLGLWADIAARADGPAACLRAGPAAAEIARRDWPEGPQDTVIEAPDAFDAAGVWEAVEELRDPLVALSAGHMAVEATRALVAVDVNTGGTLGPAAALTANLAAARALPRQLRLRGLGGQVVVDFAPLSKADRPKIEAALTAALRGDGIDTTLAGWTPLGHLELIRKRARRPLV